MYDEDSNKYEKSHRESCRLLNMHLESRVAQRDVITYSMNSSNYSSIYAEFGPPNSINAFLQQGCFWLACLCLPGLLRRFKQGKQAYDVFNSIAE